MLFRAKTDHWCAKPPELDLSDIDWRYLVSPLKVKETTAKKNETTNCKESEKIEYDMCHMYDVNFTALFEKHNGNLQNVKGNLYHR